MPMLKPKAPAAPSTPRASSIPDRFKEYAKGKGVWGQFDPFRVGHAANWEFYGGDRASYESLSADQFAEFQWLQGGTTATGVHPWLQAAAEKAKTEGRKFTYQDRQDVIRDWIKSKGWTQATTPGSLQAPVKPLGQIDFTDPALKAARKSQMIRQRQMQGRGSTFLSPRGDTTTPLLGRTILGGG